MSGRTKRLTLDWGAGQSEKAKVENWPGRFATAARSPTLCTYYTQESRKNERRCSPRWYPLQLLFFRSRPPGPGRLPRCLKGVANAASVLLVIACPQRNQCHLRRVGLSCARSKSVTSAVVPIGRVRTNR